MQSYKWHLAYIGIACIGHTIDFIILLLAPEVVPLSVFVVLLVFVLLMVFGFAELHAATRVVMPTHRQAGFEFTFWVVYKIWWHVCLDFSVFLNAM